MISRRAVRPLIALVVVLAGVAGCEGGSHVSGPSFCRTLAGPLQAFYKLENKAAGGDLPSAKYSQLAQTTSALAKAYTDASGQVPTTYRAGFQAQGAIFAQTAKLAAASGPGADVATRIQQLETPHQQQISADGSLLKQRCGGASVFTG